MGYMIPKKVHQEKDNYLRVFNVVQQVQPTQEWLTLVCITSVISYSGEQHGKSVSGQMVPKHASQLGNLMKVTGGMSDAQGR